jgi:AbiV family abortive infection protein
MTAIEIPIDGLDLQLERIAGNVQRLVDESRMLAGVDSKAHAAAMSVFALKEVVKYRSLKQARKAAVAAGNTKLNVDERIFGWGHGAHAEKLRLARDWNLIPDDAWEIHKGHFSSRYFAWPWFDVERVLSTTLRTQSIFVDWDRKKHVWINPPLVDTDRLEHSNDSILKALDRVESET